MHMLGRRPPAFGRQRPVRRRTARPPTSIPQSWDWTSGYHISDTTVIGFSHTHLNGTGIGDLFDVTVMPVVGQVTYARGTDDPSRACGRISAMPMKRPARAITPRGSTATASTWS